MGRRMRILVDVDDVVADFRWAYAQAALSLLGKVHYQTEHWNVDEGLTPAEKGKMSQAMREPGFLDSLRPLPFAKTAVKELNEIGDVYFVTAYKGTASTWTHDRSNWLLKHFGQKLGSKVVHTKHKHTTWGDLFIDDKPDHSKAWLEAMRPIIPHAEAWLRDWAYNRGFDIPGFDDWKTVVDAARRIKATSL